MSLVRCYPNEVEAAAACGQAILRHMNAAIAERGRALLAVSGGASPRFLFRFLAQARQDWSRVHLYWVDERCVPPEDPRSNYRLARETWLDPVRFPGGNVHRVCPEFGPREAAKRYDAELRQAGPFDVIHRGMGIDGHTASLFPGDPLIRDRERFAAAAAGDPPRITMLPAVLEAARHTVILVTGANKAEMLDHVLRSPYDPVKYPAQIAALDASTAQWYVDRDAYPQGELC
jgi:6-phosphogluconolactonase